MTAVIAACAFVLGCRGEELRVPQDTFAHALDSDPETFDPGIMSGSVEGEVAYQIFEGLYSPAVGSGPPVPGVAERYEQSDDGKVYTFFLRDDARWSNGDPVTAHDFVYSWLRILRGDVAADYIGFMRYLKNGRAFEEGRAEEADVGVRAVDDRTLRVELENPLPYFMEIVTFYTFFPVHRGSIEAHGQEGAFHVDNLVTNGPFEMTEYNRRRSIEFEPNPHYWGRDELGIEHVRYLIIEDSAAQVTAYLDGRVDWISTLPNNQLASLRARPDFRFGNMLGTYYYRFNVTREPLDDPRVRHAMSLAINREEICDCTLFGLYNPSEGFVPPIPGYDGVETIEFDPAEGRRLLAEAGFPGGEGFPKLTLLYNTSENHKVIAQAIQDMWKVELGIEVELLNQEWKVYLESTEALDYEVGRAGWIGDYNDPNTFLELWRGDDPNNNTGWENDEYDELISASLRETDPSRRREILRDAEALLLEELPVMPIYFYAQFHLVRPNVRGWELNLRDIHLARYISKEPLQESEE